MTPLAPELELEVAAAASLVMDAIPDAVPLVVCVTTGDGSADDTDVHRLSPAARRSPDSTGAALRMRSAFSKTRLGPVLSWFMATRIRG